MPRSHKTKRALIRDHAPEIIKHETRFFWVYLGTVVAMVVAVTKLITALPEQTALAVTLVLCLVLALGMTVPRVMHYMHYRDVIQQANDHLSAIQDALGPHLITWDRSEALERRAPRVRVITRDLVWVRDKKDEVLDELESNLDHSYEYIVFGNDPNAQGRADTLNGEAAARGVQDRLTIMSLNDLADWKKLGDHEWLDLPLPGDVCIYEDTYIDEGDHPETVVVTSTRPVTKTAVADARFKYDVMFTDDRMKNFVLGWFKTTAELLGNDE